MLQSAQGQQIIQASNGQQIVVPIQGQAQQQTIQVIMTDIKLLGFRKNIVSKLTRVCEGSERNLCTALIHHKTNHGLSAIFEGKCENFKKNMERP